MVAVNNNNNNDNGPSVNGWGDSQRLKVQKFTLEIPVERWFLLGFFFVCLGWTSGGLRYLEEEEEEEEEMRGAVRGWFAFFMSSFTQCGSSSTNNTLMDSEVR